MQNVILQPAEIRLSGWIPLVWKQNYERAFTNDILRPGPEPNGTAQETTQVRRTYEAAAGRKEFTI